MIERTGVVIQARLLLLVCVSLTAFLEHGRAQQPQAGSSTEYKRAIIRDIEKADSLLLQGDEGAAIDAYDDVLRKLGVEVAKDRQYELIKADEVENPLLAGIVLGHLAKAHLGRMLARPGAKPKDTDDGEKTADRHRRGTSALETSNALLNAARDRLITNGLYALQLPERLEINNELRSNYDLLVEDLVDTSYRLGEKGIVLLTFAKVLQSRSRAFLEALWVRRALARLATKIPADFLDAYSEWFLEQFRIGYLRSAYLLESEDDNPRQQLLDWLGQQTSQALPEVQKQGAGLEKRVSSLTPALFEQLQKVTIYPSSDLGAGFLAKPGLQETDVLVHYHVTDQNVFAFVYPANVSNPDNIALVRLHAEPKSLEAGVRNYLERLRRKEPVWKTQSQELFLQVFADLVPYLRGKKRVFIVPSGALNSLPFQTLIDPLTEAPLTTRFDILLLPNAELLGPLVSAPDAGPIENRALVLGVGSFTSLPALARTEAEARAVAETLGNSADLRLDSRGEASVEAIAPTLSQYSVIHIASHAIFDRRPMYSRVVLKNKSGEEAPITGFDLLRGSIRLKGALVTLSACDSGTVEVDRGEDALGLSTGFFIAGARVLVASLWPVEERSTELLMVKFYQGLQEGSDVASALYDAEHWLRSEHPQYSHPHYWGAFAVIGDGRLTLSTSAKK